MKLVMLFVLAYLWVLVRVVMRFGGLVLVVGRLAQLYLVRQQRDASQSALYYNVRYVFVQGTLRATPRHCNCKQC